MSGVIGELVIGVGVIGAGGDATPAVSFGELPLHARTMLDRLLASLTRVYDTSPDATLGLRLTYETGTMQWSIADDTLTTSVIDGSGEALSVDLSGYTLSTLAAYLSAQPGYDVLFLVEDDGLSSLSALALVPDSGDIRTSNGDHLFVARNPTWTHLAAIAAELIVAQEQIIAAPLEMATSSADGEWLDLLGSYYAVPRQLGELDNQYGPRIPAEVILPRQNNTAIAAALTAATGQIAVCNDAPVFGSPQPAFDASISFSGPPHFFNAVARIIFNLFDVVIGYDLLGIYSPADFLAAVRGQIDRLRAAGTHLRNLTTTASIMGDTVLGGSDSIIETIVRVSLIGSGSSADNAIAAGFFPVLLFPLSFSSDHGQATLTTTLSLTGTGQSVDRVAIPLGTATGAGANAGNGVLRAGSAAVLVGTSTSLSTAFGALGSQAFLNALVVSNDSAIATLRTGAGLVGTGGGIDTAVLTISRSFSSDFSSDFGYTIRGFSGGFSGGFR